MKTTLSENDFFGSERVSRILLKIAPPVMLSQLIQALYNIVDSFFVGRYSADALTAVSVIYPIQLIIVALSVGTGVGVNTYMAKKYAEGDTRGAHYTAGTGMVLELVTWAVLAILSALFMRPYVMTSATEPGAIEQAVIYGNIVCIGSIATFLEGNWTKVHQSRGNMRLPMFAQIAGALTNVVLDPVFIFGLGPVPEMGIAGAAYATVIGQCVSAVITGLRGFHMPPAIMEMPQYIKNIYRLGYPSMSMQMMYTIYIAILNMILATFSDAAVTVLGLYYKAQSFFFIPLLGLQTCIVPVLSYNFTRSNYLRCRQTVRDSLFISLAFMALGIVCFTCLPGQVISIFSSSADVLAIGKIAFPIIGTSFASAVFSLMLPVFFQAIGSGPKSVLLSLTRQIFVLMPAFWALSRIGLDYSWFAFPIAETVAGAIGLVLYKIQLKKWGVDKPIKQLETVKAGA